MLKHSAWLAIAHKQYVRLFFQKKLSVDKRINDKVFVTVAKEVGNWKWGI